MTSDRSEQSAAAETGSVSYEPPAVTLLGTVAELTQVGAAPTDELLTNGSAA